MARYQKKEARDWAKTHLRGVANVVTPSYTGDLKGLNEKGIRHDIRKEIEYGFAGYAVWVSESLDQRSTNIDSSSNGRTTRRAAA